MLGGVHVQLKQRSVPGLQSSVAIVDHLLGNSDYWESVHLSHPRQPYLQEMGEN